jgi:hypothetical protein
MENNILENINILIEEMQKRGKRLRGSNVVIKDRSGRTAHRNDPSKKTEVKSGVVGALTSFFSNTSKRNEDTRKRGNALPGAH